MSYRNTDAECANPWAQNFDPPLNSTANGGFEHTYHPRMDGRDPPLMGGVPYPAYSQTPHGVAFQQPMQYQHPMMMPQFQQPVYIQPGQPIPMGQYAGQPAQVYGYPGGSYPGLGQTPLTPGNVAVPGGAMPGKPFPYPDVMGIGKTESEVRQEMADASSQNEVNQPADICPADPNPSRMFWFRELDGNWTQRNRFTIDRFTSDGDARWYVRPDGIFYAVKLPE